MILETPTVAATAPVLPAPAGQEPPSSRRRHKSAQAALAGRGRGERAIALAVFVFCLGVGLWNVTDGSPFLDDEGVYTAQALWVTQGELAPYTYWYDHPPLGWMLLAGLGALPRALGVGDGSELPAMRAVMGFLFAVTATLVHLIARRLGASRTVSIAAVLLFIASPLSLTFARQVFLDNLLTPWVLLAFWFAISPKRALWSHLGSGVAFGAALLTKITAAVFGPALLVALLSQGRWRGRSLSLTGFLIAGGLVFALFPLLATLRSELITGEGHVSLQDALMFQLGTRATSGSFWDPSSDRYELVVGWFHTDPIIIVAGALGAVVCAFVAATRWISVALFSFAVPMVFGTGYLPGMYITGSLALLALAAGMGIHHLWRALSAALVRAQAWRPAVLRPTRLSLLRGSVALAVVGAMGVLIVPVWRAGSVPQLSAQSNADWRETMAWIEQNVPVADDIVVPVSAWTEIQEQGRGGPWNVIMLEKLDRDPQFFAEHPRGWESLEWFVVGPTVSKDLANLGLEEASQAYEASRAVVTFGDWQVREIVAPSED